MHSEHTVYEDIVCSESKHIESVPEDPVLLHHWCTEDSPGSSSASNTDSGNASYITDGSLNYLKYEQFKSQSSHDSSFSSFQAGEKPSNLEHVAQSNSSSAQ